MNKKESKKGTLVGFGVGAIFFALFFYGAQQLFKPDLESELKEVAVELNRQSPVQIDEFTRLDSAASRGKTNLIYYYTLTGTEKSEVNVDTINKYLRPGVIENVKYHPDLKVFRDNNITLDYNYYDRNREFIAEISVTPDLYKDQNN
ncbi:hypothetical protein [Salinimicrobium xinjiangense]|uniref:hypothetical protein n=1 Tax=Salinimicrobium xinjiangense TaxID=438596 RepID=UPI000423089F|nr:hypothetical protein [Salinimicrobium xinjiangense]